MDGQRLEEVFIVDAVDVEVVSLASEFMPVEVLDQIGIKATSEVLCDADVELTVSHLCQSGKQLHDADDWKVPVAARAQASPLPFGRFTRHGPEKNVNDGSRAVHLQGCEIHNVDASEMRTEGCVGRPDVAIEDLEERNPRVDVHLVPFAEVLLLMRFLSVAVFLVRVRPFVLALSIRVRFEIADAVIADLVRNHPTTIWGCAGDWRQHAPHHR